MTPDLTVVTATCDQPIGLGFCAEFVERQTIRGSRWIEWIVVDDGVEASPAPAFARRVIRREREPNCLGAESFCRNWLEALPFIRAPYVAFVEHDDWYRPDHLAVLVERLERTGAAIAGDDEQRYYHVGQRCWLRLQNKGAALCQTVMRRELLPLFEEVLRDCLRRRVYGVDAALWARVPGAGQTLEQARTVVGIKGLPGRPGLGIGHRPTARWTPDPDLVVLREWLGDEVDRYARFGACQAVA